MVWWVTSTTVWLAEEESETGWLEILFTSLEVELLNKVNVEDRGVIEVTVLVLLEVFCGVFISKLRHPFGVLICPSGHSSVCSDVLIDDD
jgi:hypothetical protein